MHSSRNRGFGLIELLMVVAIIGILAAINVPALLRARASANEASAIASLQAINNAHRAFASSCGSGFYAPSLQALGVPPDDRSEAFLSPDLAAPAPVNKSGYEIALSGDRPDTPPSDDSCSHTNGGPAASELVEGYYLTAVAQGSFSGSRNFWTNTSGSLFEKPQQNVFTSTNVTGGPERDPGATLANSSSRSGKENTNSQPAR